MSSKSLCDKTRLRGDLGLRCQGRRNECVCAFLCYFRSFLPSCFPPFALSAVPSFVSERGCDPVWRDGLLGFSLSISWKITAQATFEEVSSHPIDPCFHHPPPSTPFGSFFSPFVCLSVRLYHCKPPHHCNKSALLPFLSSSCLVCLLAITSIPLLLTPSSPIHLHA